MTEITILPQAIQQNNRQQSGSVFIHKHISYKNSLRNKILLQQNLISLLLNGEKVLHYSDKSTSINSSQFVLLSSGNCLMTENLSNSREYSSILFFFDDEVLTNFFVKYASLTTNVKAKNDVVKDPFIVLDKDDFITNYATSFDFMLQHKIPVSDEMKQLKFEELMLYLFEKYPETIVSFQKLKQKEYSDFEIKKVVESNITANITLEELAFLCNTSISTFKRRFAKLYKVSPSQYFLHRKMEIAASLLVHHNENPSEVFYKIGYENHSSFSQSFKQIYGLSPKQYQQQNLTVQQ